LFYGEVGVIITFDVFKYYCLQGSVTSDTEMSQPFLKRFFIFSRELEITGDAVSVLTVVAGHHSEIKVWGGRRGIVLSVRANVRPDSLQNGQTRANRGDLLRSLAFEDFAS
jgi:hypothetical protein